MANWKDRLMAYLTEDDEVNLKHPDTASSPASRWQQALFRDLEDDTPADLLEEALQVKADGLEEASLGQPASRPWVLVGMISLTVWVFYWGVLLLIALLQDDWLALLQHFLFMTLPPVVISLVAYGVQSLTHRINGRRDRQSPNQAMTHPTPVESPTPLPAD